MPLQKRVVQLEKAKSDRKRAAVAVKAQTKRPRASNGAGGGYNSNGGNTGSNNNNENRSYYRAPADRGQYGGVPVSSYSMQAQNTYDRRGQGGYSTTYAGGNRSPVSLSSSYLYSADGLGSPVYGSSAYTNPSNTYSSYQFGSGLPPPPPAYQASFLHWEILGESISFASCCGLSCTFSMIWHEKLASWACSCFAFIRVQES